MQYSVPIINRGVFLWKPPKKIGFPLKPSKQRGYLPKSTLPYMDFSQNAGPHPRGLSPCWCPFKPLQTGLPHFEKPPEIDMYCLTKMCTGLPHFENPPKKKQNQHIAREQWGAFGLQVAGAPGARCRRSAGAPGSGRPPKGSFVEWG